MNQDNRFQCSAAIIAQNNGNKNPEEVVTMFDICSSHHFVTTSTAKKRSLKKVCMYEVGNYRKIYAIAVPDDPGLGTRNKPDNVKFANLCKAFKIHHNQVEITYSPIRLLLDLKAHSLQAQLLPQFTSPIYPNMGVYSSPLCVKKFFVWVINTDTNDTNEDFFANKIPLTGIRKFLDSEWDFHIGDPKCKNCQVSSECKFCKYLSKPTSLTELVEAEKLANFVKIEDENNKNKLSLAEQKPFKLSWI